MPGRRFRPDVCTLREVIAASPIVVAAAAPCDFAEWCRRQPGDLDTVILDWLRSERQAAART